MIPLTLGTLGCVALLWLLGVKRRGIVDCARWNLDAELDESPRIRQMNEWRKRWKSDLIFWESRTQTISRPLRPEGTASGTAAQSGGRGAGSGGSVTLPPSASETSTN